MSAILSSELVKEILPREIDLATWDNNGLVQFAQRKVLERLEGFLRRAGDGIFDWNSFCKHLGWESVDREGAFDEAMLNDHPAVYSQLSNWIDCKVYKMLRHVQSQVPSLPEYINQEILFLNSKRISAVG